MMADVNNMCFFSRMRRSFEQRGLKENSGKPSRKLLASSTAFLCSALSAQADGYILQADAGKETQGLVAAYARGAVNYGFNFSEYEDGRSIVASVTYAFPLGDVATAKFGPSLGTQREVGGWSDAELGVKLSLERYTATSFGGVFTLAKLNTIDNAWFFLGQLSLDRSGYGIELSRGGSDENVRSSV